jgi:hypothetical protein
MIRVGDKFPLMRLSTKLLVVIYLIRANYIIIIMFYTYQLNAMRTYTL